MLETFQGWGALFYPKIYVQQLAKICKSNNILLAFDEMQSGFGRTGKKFGYQHYEVEPNLICVGKGMGGGLPISGVIGDPWIMDIPDIGNMSSTHSGNPLACSAGLAVLEEIENRDLCEESSRKGEILKNLLQDLAADYDTCIERITCTGLIAAIFFKDFNSLKASQLGTFFALETMKRGLLVVHTGRETVKLGPPLTIPVEAIEEAIDVMREVLDLIKFKYT